MINKISKEARPRVKDFLEVVSKYFQFLEEYGYNLREQRIATEYIVKDIVQVIYYNKSINRFIVIYYQPKDIDGEDVDLVTLSFYDDDDHILSNNEILFSKYIEKYATENNIDLEKLKYLNKNNKETFRKNMEASMSGYVYFLKDIGMKLITGEEWEKGLIIDISSAETMLYEQQKKELGKDDI